MFGAFYDSKIRNHIVDAASMPSLFYIILNDFVEKRNRTQVSPQLQSKWSDQPKIQVQGRMQSKQCPTRRALAVGLKHAGLLPPRSPRPVTTAACAPCGARNSVVGRYAAATAAAGPAEPAAVAAVAAAATRQDQARQLTYFRRYSGDTPAIP